MGVVPIDVPMYKQMCPVLDFFRRRLLRSAGLDRADAPFAAADLDFTATSFGAGSAALAAAALSSDSDDSFSELLSDSGLIESPAASVVGAYMFLHEMTCIHIARHALM